MIRCEHTATTEAVLSSRFFFARDGDTYRGRWRFDKDQNKWSGNPTRSAEVENLMISIKHKDSAEGGERSHSLAMSKSFMDKIHAWSARECPKMDFESLPKDHASLKSAAEHLRFHAFASTGWTVWSR